MAVKRRPKGSGTIMKLGTRSWLARYTAPDGSKPSRQFTKQADAAEWLDKQVKAVREGAYIPPSDQMLSQWIAKYLAAYKAEVASSTKESYDGSVNRLNTYASDLMSMPLDTIMEPDIQKALNAIRAALSHRTTEITRTLLNMALAKALELHMIRINPATGTIIAKSQEVKRARYIEPETLKAITEYCLSEPYRESSRVYQDVIYFILITGCRGQDARGLQASRILANGCRIDTALDRKNKKKTTKNRRTRYITLPDDVLEMCKRRAKHSISGYVFETMTGQPLNHRNISRRLEAISGGHTPHDLRHTFGTNAIRNGANIKAVADYMGDEIETVLKVYVHTDHSDLTKVHLLAAKPNKIVEFKAE